MQRTLAGLGLLRGGLRRADAAVLHHQRVDRRQQQAEQRHADERPAPAQLLGEHTAEGHAQHRAEHAAGHEGAGQGGAHAGGEDREHQGDADAAVGGLADAYQEAREEHVLVVFRQAAAEGRQAPEHGHQRQAPGPAPAVGDQGKGEGQQADHQRDDAAEQAELRIAQAPFGLEQRKHRIEHLPRHVVGDQQAEGQGEHHPGVGTGNPGFALVGVAGGSGMEGHGGEYLVVVLKKDRLPAIGAGKRDPAT
ncbi:hypothetical protein D9M71_359600 [compost metagenome]